MWWTLGTALLSIIGFFVVPFIARKLYTKYVHVPWNPRGKGIVITGASSGIGEELAYQFAAAGAKLVLCARREEELKAVADKCRKLGAQHVSYVLVDVSVQEDNQKMAKEAEKALGGVVDCAILNAGISMGAPFEKITDLSIFRRLIDVNYYGVIDGLHYLLPLLKKSQRPIIAPVSSLAGKIGTPERTGYSATKFALHGFFDALRLELHQYHAQITMICPGFVQTNINNTRLGESPSHFDISKAMPVKQAGNIIINALIEGKREILFPIEGPIGQYLSFFFPELFDWIMIRRAKSAFIPNPNASK